MPHVSVGRSRPVLLVAVCTLLACAEHVTTPPVQPTPTPAPEPTATPRISACGVGPGTGDGKEENCPRQQSNFLFQVNAAIDEVVRKHPGLFDLDDIRGAGGYYVLNVDEYFRQVVREVEAQGLCATVDGGDEIAVKKTNDFNDQYHVMISDHHIRRGETSYRATCYPAWF
jgi:hypothetical protein